MNVKKGREFVHRNARPLEMALWEYHFEGGCAEDVLRQLAFYQNEDGGFGHAIEADFWNPQSTPIGTWKATEILAEIECSDNEHPIIQGILRYLDSKEGFDETTGQWENTVPSNNDYPHAIWWENHGSPTEFNPNPTAALAEFILTHAKKESGLYQWGCDLAKRCLDHMVEHEPIKEMHAITCYIRLYRCLKELGEKVIFDKNQAVVADMEQLEKCIRLMVDCELCMDIERWGKDYVSMPSSYIDSPKSFLYEGKQELIKEECRLIKEQQLADGSFAVPWNWGTEYKEYEIAVNWWKSELIRQKFLFLQAFGELKIN